MPHALIQVEQLADLALANLYESVALPQLVHRDYESDLTERGRGDTIQIRRPASFVAKDFETEIELQDATEGKIEISLKNIADVSFAITDKELTQDVASLEAQFIAPAMQALATKMNRVILDGLVAAAPAEVGTGSDTSRPFQLSNPKVLVDAGAKLDAALAPVTERVALIGTNTKADWLSNDYIVKAEKTGATEALRNGSIGRDLFGFETYGTTDVKAPAVEPAVGAPTTEVNVAYHR